MSELLDTFERATEKDLDEIASQRQELENRVSALKQIEKVLRIKFGREEPRSPARTSGKKKGPSKKAQEICRLIRDNGGSMILTILMNQMEMTEHAVRLVATRNSDYLVIDGDSIYVRD